MVVGLRYRRHGSGGKFGLAPRTGRRFAEAKRGKRVFDFFCAALGLLLLLPLFLLISLVIKLDDGGPVLFVQERVGFRARPFLIRKFRSMGRDAAGVGRPLTVARDRRITRVGGWLRRTKLDELPQLLNVLTGDMSLVGPRPEVPAYVRYYTEEERSVFTVLPGITGLSQVLFRDEESLLRGDDPEAFYIEVLMHRKLALDCAYAAKHSFAIDVAILVITVVALVAPSMGARLACAFVRRVYGLDVRPWFVCLGS